MRSFVWLTGATAVVLSCSSSSPPPPPAPAPLTQQELQDPTTCLGCHGDAYSQWASSMHAYASQDPVFLALNARGQRETGGTLGTFCVQCHAPVAVRLGLTTDGLNLASLPASVKGVTCYFCHSSTPGSGLNDNPLVLASDGVMRAAIKDPLSSAPHGAGYSVSHDQHVLTSSALCGTCHDITNQHGVALERTFAEWEPSEFSRQLATTDNSRSCGSCHMPKSQGLAARYPPNAPTREIHDHSMAGVDLAVTDFPGKDAQRTLVQQQLDAAVSLHLCVGAPSSGSVQVTLESEGVGHSWPSGAVQDRRAWLEMVATSAGQTVFQTGVVPDGGSVGALSDPNLWLMREAMFDAQSKETKFMWQAMSLGAAVSLPVATDVTGPGSVHSVTRTFAVPVSADSITARVRIVPIDQEILADLVASGDLDPMLPAALPVFSLAGTTVKWTAGGSPCVP